MGQFDVFRLDSGQLVVDMQTDLIGLNATRIVAPLRSADMHAVLAGLTPVIEFAGEDWVVRIQELGAIPQTELKVLEGSLRAQQDRLLCGLGILIHGV
tara:strand:- start:5097 stop:5390 length:294 start_codon:yes stop_codon:yes gene_type:complete